MSDVETAVSVSQIVAPVNDHDGDISVAVREISEFI